MELLEYEAYKKERDRLLDEAEAIINKKPSSKEEYKKAEIEIEKLFNKVDALDNKYNSPTNQANIKALEDKNSIDPSAIGLFENNNYINLEGGTENSMNQKLNNEYREQFFNGLQGKLTNASLTTTTGASVIPTQTWDNILQGIRKTNGILSDVRILNVNGNFTIPMEATTGAATFKEELVESPDATGTYKSITLTGHELMKVISMSEASLSMSIDQFENYLSEELTYSMQLALNNAIWNGKGATSFEPKGILTETFDTTNSVEYTAINPSVIIQAIGKLPSNYRDGAKVYCNSATYFEMMSSSNSVGDLNIITSAENSPIGKVLGLYDLRVDDSLADGVIMIGNPMFYFLNFNKPIELAKDTSAGFTSATVKFRALSVVDGALATNRAFVKLSKKATA